MNVKANMLIQNLHEVRSIYVMPSASDESLAIGAALYFYYNIKKIFNDENGRLQNLYLGTSVNDNEVKKTIIELAENIKIIAEPGGAVAATALLTNKINVKNKNVIVMISGGNIDYEFFSSIVNDNQ